MGFSGKGATVSLDDGTTLIVQFTVRNLAHMEEAFGSHATYAAGMIRQPLTTMARMLTVTGAVPDTEAAYAALEKCDFNAAREALDEAYYGSLPWLKMEPREQVRDLVRKVIEATTPYLPEDPSEDEPSPEAQHLMDATRAFLDTVQALLPGPAPTPEPEEGARPTTP